MAWCKSGGVIALSGGLAGLCQAATAGSPTSGSSLKGAICLKGILVSIRRTKHASAENHSRNDC